MKLIVEKLSLSLVNIFCPPLAVYLIAGAGPDVILNCVLFILGVLPAHCQSFYLTYVYFHRKRKVKRGQALGGKRPLIWSERVLRGGASAEEVRRLRQEADTREVEKQRVKSVRRMRRRESARRAFGIGGGRMPEEWKEQDTADGWENSSGFYETVSNTTSLSPISTRTNTSPSMARSPHRLSRQQSYPETSSFAASLPQRHPTVRAERQRQNLLLDEGPRPPLPQRSQTTALARQNHSMVSSQPSPVPIPMRQDSHGANQRDFLGFYGPNEYQR
jgi:uncharacterized membrane protein YqaE (UPF0057 family)